MSASNGHSPNSLLVLEQSLRDGCLAIKSASPILKLEETEVSAAPQSSEMEARSFDWDEEIALEYTDEEGSPEAAAMNWQGEAESSHSFGLEDEDPTGNIANAEDPLSHSNSLFALEQSVFSPSSSSQVSSAQSTEELSEEYAQPLQIEAPPI